MKVEKQLTCLGDGKLINVHLDSFRGERLVTSRLIHTMTIEEADAFVKALSVEIHRDPRGDTLISRFGGMR